MTQTQKSWTGAPRSQVMLNGQQVAEVMLEGPSKVIRDLSSDGALRTCFESIRWKEIHDWLDRNFPGCTYNT
jgi:hypothetical protein